MAYIPTVTENEGGNRERSFDIYSRLLKDRIILIGRPIDDVVANLVVAQLIYLAADDPASATIHMHQPLIGGKGLQGQASDLDIHAREIVRIRSVLNELIAKHTGQALERVERDTDRDFFLNPEEAVEYGLIDGIIQKTPVPVLAATATR